MYEGQLLIIVYFHYLSYHNTVKSSYRFSWKEVTFVALAVLEHYPGYFCCESHINLYRHYLRNEHRLGADFLIGHFEARSASACPDPCPLFLHATLYNKTITRHRRETGLSCLALLSGWTAQSGAEVPWGSISKQRYRVPVAIRSGAHAKFSTLYVDWDMSRGRRQGVIF